MMRSTFAYLKIFRIMILYEFYILHDSFLNLLEFEGFLKGFKDPFENYREIQSFGSNEHRPEKRTFIDSNRIFSLIKNSLRLIQFSRETLKIRTGP